MAHLQAMAEEAYDPVTATELSRLLAAAVGSRAVLADAAAWSAADAVDGAGARAGAGGAAAVAAAAEEGRRERVSGTTAAMVVPVEQLDAIVSDVKRAMMADGKDGAPSFFSTHTQALVSR